MHLRRPLSRLAFVALATGAAGLACSETPDDFGEGSRGGTGGTSGVTSTGGTTGGGGTSGAAGTTANGGTVGSAGMAGTPSLGGASGSAGSVGQGGGSAAGSGGTSGGAAGNATGGDGAAGNATGGGGAAGSGGTSGGAAGSATGGGSGAGSSGKGGGGGAGGGSMGAAPSSGCGKAPALTSGRASIDVAGKMREYILAVPSNYDQNKPYRLIFGWHPWGGSAQQIAQGGYFGLSSVISGQAILVAPEGQDYQNNGLGWGNANGEDIAFAHAMMDRFGAGLCIDQNRIFSTGFSFGAMFSFTLACTENSGMRAIAPMAGNSTTSGRCENSTRSVATMAFIGTDDTLLAGHRTAVQIFVGRDGCSTQKTPVVPSWCDGLNSNFQPCSCVQYQGCKAGYPVIECEYKAGHQFAPSAGSTLWSFFSQF